MDTAGSRGADLLIVALKYGVLPGAMGSIRTITAENTTVMSLMNSVDSEERIAAEIGAQHLLHSLIKVVYSIVNQLFISNLLGTDALSAVSIAGPFLAIALAIGTMIATGGCALVSRRMGEGKVQKARENFSFFTLFSVAISTAFCVVGILLRQPILYAMGADAALYPLCEAYAVPIFLLISFAMVSIILQMFFVAAGRPGLGFGLSIAGGVVNKERVWKTYRIN